MTTHNIQLGINIDDESIINAVRENARKQISRGLFGSEEICNTSYWGRVTFSNEFKGSCIDPYLEELFKNPEIREMIAKYTAEILSGRLMNSNKFKEQVKDRI